MLNIQQVLAIVKRIHDEEGYDLGNGGSGEARAYRNAFWARAIGCCHHGHPVYNPGNADSQWCIKDAGGGRPQSDDVTSIGTPSPGSTYQPRDSWDCIPGSGLPGYHFEANYIGALPPEQNIYDPPVPAGGTGSGGGGTGGGSQGEVVFPPRQDGLMFYTDLDRKYQVDRHAPISQTYINAEGVSVWYAEYLRHRVNGKSHVEAQNIVFADIDKIPL